MAIQSPSKPLSLPQWVKNDKYWHSSLYILGLLASRNSKFRPLLQTFVDFDETTIDFSAMKKAISAWSHGEQIMVQLAAHLFNQVHNFDLSVLDYLDSENLRIAFRAMEIRYRK